MSNTVVSRFQGEIISSHPAVAVAISPDGRHAFVSVPSRNYSFLIETDTGKVVKFLPSGTMRIIKCVFSRDGKRGYCITKEKSGVSSFTVAGWAGGRLVYFDEPMRAIAVAADGAHLYVAKGEEVVVLDSLSLGATEVTPVGGVVDSLAVSPDGLYLYILVGGKFLIASVADWAIKSISIGAGTGCMSLSLDGRRAYVAGTYQGGTVQTIDIVAEQVVASMPIKGDAKSCVLCPTGEYLYVTTDNEPLLYGIDVVGDPKLVEEINVGGNPMGVDVTPDGARVYVCTGDFVKAVVATR
ncbi:hypothetical protein K5R88_29405 [Pseudomonas sp. MM213]|uniref:hypothetical protein n=1 Tax=unclassified Pseudomonas TaxID=196821 RepID=UPI001CBF1D73|nr:MULTISPECIES: hypothetical protein [unclassified Pseudomonas]UCP09864.1 hypothetical protein K5R88_29405 [Pseudomonas sp. MM213]